MKRIISCLLLAAVTLLSGCSVVKPKLDPNAFYVEVDVKCEGVYILECEYSLDGEPVGGRSVQNADFAKDIPEGDTEYCRFLPEDFPSSADVEGGVFGISFTIVDINGTRRAAVPAPERYVGTYYALNTNEDCINEWSWNAQFSGECKFALEKSQGGYSIYPIN